MIRAVIDTNVLVSGLLSPAGNEALILLAVHQGLVRPYLCDEVLESGGLPGDVFVDHLGVPLIWVPHSYNGCKQHGPDEHLLVPVAREGMAAFAGLWWDLGEAGTP